MPNPNVGAVAAMPTHILVLTLAGAFGFGLVVGWVTHRTLRRTTRGGIGDIMAVIGVVGGSAVFAQLPVNTGAFGVYCSGLALGFFGYLAVLWVRSDYEVTFSREVTYSPPTTPTGDLQVAQDIDIVDWGEVTAVDWGEVTVGDLMRDLSVCQITIDDRPSDTSTRPTEQAPRVLNANFAGPPGGGVLKPTTALVAGQEYELLVDVGPRWDKIPSLVVGNAAFPEDALPPDPIGHDLLVVLVSVDFEPRLVTGQIWLPSGSGRSIPYWQGRRGDQPGPLPLRVHAPSLPESAGEGPVEARARLCLYYENNLLQSALVRAGIMRKPETALTKPNAVEVDFVLSKAFRNVEQFASRAVRFGPKDDAGSHPVMLNLTLNGDGSGKHRILVKKQAALPTGWMSYDPANSAKVLENARVALGACFYRRNAQGHFARNERGTPQVGLDRDNGKPIDQFKWDLKNLAEVGSALFNLIFLQVNTEDAKMTAKAWVDALNRVLAHTAVIQVARTAPANYVFPWGLVYEHPLFDPSLTKFCKVVKEDWGPTCGPRVDPLNRTRCPYHDESWHRNNILCPYGFWGLKHVIEQPPSELTEQRAEGDEVDRTIRVKPPIPLGVAVSLDQNFDRKLLDAHLDWLQRLPSLAFQPPAADDWDEVCTMFEAPRLVYYFLCHDEWDAAQDDAYLGVGPRDDDAAHRIYAQRLVAWLRDTSKSWSDRRPLVFINGCHTADLRPGQVLNFVPAFTAAGASGVIGTEVSVIFPVAIEVGRLLLGRLATQVSVGEAMRAVRWELARKGNLLGLAYTMYCFADLRFVAEAASK